MGRLGSVTSLGGCPPENVIAILMFRWDCDIIRAMKIKRDFYLDRLIEAKGDGFVKIITGIRR